MDTLNSDATQGTQQAFPLRAVGYFEPRPSSPSYPFLPLPDQCPHCGAPDPGIGPDQCGCSGAEEEAIRFLHRMTAHYGHCGQ